MGLPRRDLRDRLLNDIQLGPRLFERDAGLEPRDGGVVELAHPADVGKVQPERHHQVELRRQRGRLGEQVERRQLGARLQHADDRVLRPAENQTAADHLRVATEPILPEPLADHGHRRVVAPFVVTRQRPPQRDRHLQHVEDGARRPHDDDLCRIAGAGEVRRPPLDFGDRRERRRLAPPLFEVPRVHRTGGVPPRGSRHHLADRHETLRLAVGERPQHHAVDDREHGRGRAEGQRERRNDGAGIHGFAPDGAQRVADVEQSDSHGGLDGAAPT